MRLLLASMMLCFSVGAQDLDPLTSERWLSTNSSQIPLEYQKAVERLGQAVGRLRVFRFDLRDMEWTPSEGGTALAVQPGDRIATACHLVATKNPIRILVDFQDVSRTVWTELRGREAYPGKSNTLTLELQSKKISQQKKSNVCEIPFLTEKEMSPGSGYENNPYYAQNRFPSAIEIKRYVTRPSYREAMALVGYPSEQKSKGVAFGSYDVVSVALKESGMSGAPVVELDPRARGGLGTLWINLGSGKK